MSGVKRQRSDLPSPRSYDTICRVSYIHNIKPENLNFIETNKWGWMKCSVPSYESAYTRRYYGLYYKIVENRAEGIEYSSTRHLRLWNLTSSEALDNLLPLNESEEEVFPDVINDIKNVFYTTNIFEEESHVIIAKHSEKIMREYHFDGIAFYSKTSKELLVYIKPQSDFKTIQAKKYSIIKSPSKPLTQIVYVIIKKETLLSTLMSQTLEDYEKLSCYFYGTACTTTSHMSELYDKPGDKYVKYFKTKMDLILIDMTTVPLASQYISSEDDDYYQYDIGSKGDIYFADIKEWHNFPNEQFLGNIDPVISCAGVMNRYSIKRTTEAQEEDSVCYEFRFKHWNECLDEVEDFGVYKSH